MKLLFCTLLIPLKLIDLTGGSCRLRVSVQTLQGPKGDDNITPTLHQTQLQLICDSVTCPETNFTNCNTYTELGISGGCMGDGCSRELNLCEDSCTINNQDHTALPHSMLLNHRALEELVSETLTPVINTCPTSMCTATATVFPRITALPSTARQSCTFTTTVMSTTTKVHEQVLTTTILTTKTWTSCSPSPFPNIRVSTVTVQLPRQPDTKSSPENKFCSASSSSALGALMGIFMVLLILVTTGWMWTCWITNKLKMKGRVQNIRISDTNINNDVTDLNFNNNPAYDTQTTLNKNVAYEDSTFHTHKEQQSSAQLSTTEPTYEIIPSATNQIASAATVMTGKESEEYNKLNVVIPNTNEATIERF